MSADKTTLGARLRTERKARDLTIPALAEALRDSAPEHERVHLPSLVDLKRKISDWENDKWGVSELYRILYCRAFGMTEEALFGAYLAEKAAKAARAKAARAEAKAKRAGRQEPAREEEESDVERRQLLQALAMLGVATVSPVTDALHTIRGHVEKSLDRDFTAQIEDWDETVAEYGYSYLATPPEQLIGELAADLVSVQALKPYLPVDSASRSRWFRVTAGLSLLLAKTLGNIGQVRPARAWWTTAQHAADSSGDVDLSMWISGERLVRGLYERRPTPVLLRQAAAVAESSSGRTSPGLLQVHTMRAQLFAVVGRADEAIAEVRRAEDAFGRLPASAKNDIASDWCFGEDRIRYMTAWVHAHLGQCGPLDVAADRAVRLLEAVDQPRSATQVKLLQAAGYVRSGDVVAGVAHATSTYEECPPGQRTALVTELAGGVWNAIPVTRRNEPAAEDYRELLARPSRKAIT